MKTLSRIITGVIGAFLGLFLLLALIFALVIWLPVAFFLKLFGVQTRSPTAFFRQRTVRPQRYPGQPQPQPETPRATAVDSDVIDISSEVISTSPRNDD